MENPVPPTFSALDVQTAPSQPTTPVTQFPWATVMVVALVAGVVFGIVGYYLGFQQASTQSLGQPSLSDTSAPMSLTSPTPVPESAQHEELPESKKLVAEPVVEFFDLPTGWIGGVNNARTNSECYQVTAQKIGQIVGRFEEYFAQEFNGANLAQARATTKQYVWEGIESYTLPSSQLGEVKSVYIRPGEDDWFKLTVNYIGEGEATSISNNSECEISEEELETVVRSVRFL